ncbi:hypothetical protein RFI_26245, partial [Reticulomyxa filosa]
FMFYITNSVLLVMSSVDHTVKESTLSFCFTCKKVVGTLTRCPNASCGVLEYIRCISYRHYNYVSHAGIQELLKSTLREVGKGEINAFFSLCKCGEHYICNCNCRYCKDIRCKFSIPTIRSQNKKIYSREKLSLYPELEKAVKSIQNIVNEYANKYYNGNNKFFENIINLCDQQSPGVDDNSQQLTLEEERKGYETKIENMKNDYDKKLEICYQNILEVSKKKVQLETTLKHVQIEQELALEKRYLEIKVQELQTKVQNKEMILTLDSLKKQHKKGTDNKWKMESMKHEPVSKRAKKEIEIIELSDSEEEVFIKREDEELHQPNNEEKK